MASRKSPSKTPKSEASTRRNTSSLKWYEKNRDKILADRKSPEYREYHKAIQRKWCKAHPGEALKHYKKWAETHIDVLEARIRAKALVSPEVAAKATRDRRIRSPAHYAAVSAAWRAKHPNYSLHLNLAKKEAIAGRKRPLKCEVCKKKKDKICYDHCHDTGDFRGWICGTCNSTIGYAKNDSRLLRKLADYLDAHKKKKRIK